MAKAEEIRSRYTRTQRFFYNLKRYFVFMVILVPALIWLYYVDPTETESSLLVLLITRTARSTIGIFLALLFSKFAFPKAAMSTEIIEDQNIAIAILLGSIILGCQL